jgi:hypothetical protein
MPDNIIFAIGVLSGIFATLTTWAYIEKRREDQPWTERTYNTESNDATVSETSSSTKRGGRFRNIQLDKLMFAALQRIGSLRSEAAKGG